MNTQTMLIFFAVPAVGILVIVITQFWDELFEKKFILERRIAVPTGSVADRKGSAAGGTRGHLGSADSLAHRYNDSPAPVVLGAKASELQPAIAAQALKPSAAHI